MIKKILAVLLFFSLFRMISAQESQSNFQTPILFLIFNRPDTTQEVFNRIRTVKPKKLFIAADGPRTTRANEYELCQKTRAIVGQIDWDCELRLLFRQENLGCGRAVSSAISWFFDHVEEGIILEDDCIPSDSFFTFCESLLSHYRNDTRIFHISGFNFQPIENAQESYYFSRMASVWGWATWRRAWQYYNLSLPSYPEFKSKSNTDGFFSNELLRHIWLNLFEKVFNNNNFTWDFQWAYTLLTNNALSITPSVNLISNIGFGPTATHTTDSSNLAFVPRGEITNIKHPSFMIPNQERERLFYSMIMGVNL